MKKILLLLSLFVSGELFCQNILGQRTDQFSKSLLLALELKITQARTDYKNSRLGTGIEGLLEYYFKSNMPSKFGLRLFIGGQNITAKDDSRIPSVIKTGMIVSGGGIIYSYSINNRFYPFIYFGLSHSWFDPQDENGSKAPNSGKNLYLKESLGYDIQAGLKFPISEYFILNAGFSVHLLNTDNLEDMSAGIHKDAYINGSLGISFSLFGERDRDDDGILNKDDACPDVAEDIDGFEDDDGCPDLDNDKDLIADINDKCPDLPEDLDGFEDNDGCPDYDNDGDGILDQDDKCPNLAEDFDGFEDTDGCPDLDNDSDGIKDSVDKCPNTPEDFDGFQDDDGCPDLDNDNDGIPDKDDKCPDLPETFNNYQDDDGCPDTAPKKAKPEEEREPKPDLSLSEIKDKFLKEESTPAPSHFLLHGENTFDESSQVIKSSAYKELNRIVNIISKYPDSRWRIEGYMDNAGDPNDLIRISKQRAEAVLNYFVSKGLPSFQFQVFGMGSKNPIDSNDKAFGRMKNRRVVIKKIR